jgi:hypothetical protein
VESVRCSVGCSAVSFNNPDEAQSLPIIVLDKEAFRRA